jgi:hypothetical protein
LLIHSARSDVYHDTRWKQPHHTWPCLRACSCHVQPATHVLHRRRRAPARAHPGRGRWVQYYFASLAASRRHRPCRLTWDVPPYSSSKSMFQPTWAGPDAPRQHYYSITHTPCTLRHNGCCWVPDRMSPGTYIMINWRSRHLGEACRPADATKLVGGASGGQWIHWLSAQACGLKPLATSSRPHPH